MSDYFRCPHCRGLEPNPGDPRAQEQGVCADCWYEYYMQGWYGLERLDKVRDRQRFLVVLVWQVAPHSKS